MLNYLDIPSIFQNAEQESRRCLYASMIRCHQFNKQKTNNKKQKKKKPETKPVDACGRGDYISQYSSIMLTFLYSTRVCNLI